jgi:hypothetical protein
VGDLEHYMQDELTKNIGVGNYQFPLFFDNPIIVGQEMHQQIDKQKHLICEFFDIVTGIARNALIDNNIELIRILFSEPVGEMTLDYHRNLPDTCWQKPIFYRTDQSISGKIYELQSPGSGWGDLSLLAKALERKGCILPDAVCNFADKYSQSIIEVTRKDVPRVVHMLDAASGPAGMRYLFTQTRPKLQYWGIDNVQMHAVDFVTAHSAAALTTCNYFNLYLSLLKEGKLVFGIQPNLLYDQKAIYLLPFYRRTKSDFSNEIRDMFPFTTFIENGGFYNENDEFITLTDFTNLRRMKKRYYLKYGGTDLSRNWGSRSVFRLDTLSKNECASLLTRTNELVKKGEMWIIQEDVSRIKATNISEDIQKLIDDGMYVKLSAFYGNNCVLGLKIMARKHFKVHGQIDTIVGLGI